MDLTYHNCLRGPVAEALEAPNTATFLLSKVRCTFNLHGKDDSRDDNEHFIGKIEDRGTRDVAAKTF